LYDSPAVVAPARSGFAQTQTPAARAEPHSEFGAASSRRRFELEAIWNPK
jgi:hypothetical protein